MILTLKTTDLLRLEQARGLTIEVLRGRAWLTEAGRRRDAFLTEGARCRVAGNGLVLVEAQGARPAEVSLRLLLAPLGSALGNGVAARLRAWRDDWRLRRQLQSLQGLDAHTLRDIGLERGPFDRGAIDR